MTECHLSVGIIFRFSYSWQKDTISGYNVALFCIKNDYSVFNFIKVLLIAEHVILCT